MPCWTLEALGKGEKHQASRNRAGDGLIRLITTGSSRRAGCSRTGIAARNGGKLPPTKHVAITLRLTVSRASDVLTELKTAGLLDLMADGTLVPLNWDKWQYKIDTSDPTAA